MKSSSREEMIPMYTARRRCVTQFQLVFAAPVKHCEAAL